MSKDLPLWNENETDVSFKYQLQYGHVLLPACDYKMLINKIRRAFKLKQPIGIYEEIKVNTIPFNIQKKVCKLYNEKEWHFLFVEYDNKLMAIYAPHFLYFNNTRWMHLNKMLNGYLITSEQGSIDEQHYRIFKKGRLYCNAYWDNKGIHKSTHAPVQVYFNKELIFYKEDDSKDLTPELLEMISNDVIVVNDAEKKIKFKSPIGDNEVTNIKSIRHVVFSNKQSTLWFLP